MMAHAAISMQIRTRSTVEILRLVAWIDETRCRRDPMEFCRYNDGVPMMAVIVIVFFVAGVVRARLAYANR